MTDDVLALDGVSVRYGPIVALDDVTMRVGRGERVALIGPSGGGKSSLLGAVAGLVAVHGGRVATLGSDRSTLDERSRRAIAARIGIVAQDLALVPSLKVVHSVNGGRLGSWSRRRAVWSLVRPAGMDAVRDALAAVRLDDRMFARTGDLSGGQQQRVAVARVLVQQPELVLADEPTSSVDPELADLVMAQLCGTGGEGPEGRRQTPAWTVVASVHDPALARRHFDRVIGIAEGRIVFDRSVDDIDPDEIDRLYEST